MPAETLVLRNYPDDDALHNPEKYSKAISFSPDIIPLYGAKADQDTLVQDASWRGFTGMPVVGGDVNNVYIRGYGSGGPYVASLRVFPSELILWPQVWTAVDPVPSGPVVIQGGDTVGRYTSSGHLQFRAPHTAGSGYSMVASVFKYDPANEHKNLQDYEPLPQFDYQHFGADDLLSYLGKDTCTTFYNVTVADPTSKHVSATTRLRMFGNSPIPVSFHIEWHKGTPIPDGLEVSLIDDRGAITIPRTQLSHFSERKVLLMPSYDGILTLNLFAPTSNAFFEPYSGLSLKASKSAILGSEPPQLLGALNVIFEPHSTRNIRYASPSATQLREYKDCSKDNDCHCPGKPEDCGPIPVTKPGVTGWWFRSMLGDTNQFPHLGQYGFTPDIQPIGTDLNAPGMWKALQDPSVDYSTEHAIELVGGEDNYIFVRGHSTIADIDVQSRLFAVKGNLFLHPSQYASQGISAKVFGESGMIDQQTISVADSNQFYLLNKPFDVQAPPDPDPGNVDPGDSWRLHTHYCLIAEVRQKRKCSLVYPSWPTQQVQDFQTLQDFEAWCASCPLICWRNIGWVPGKPGDQCWTWYCETQLDIPDFSFSSSFWTIIVECDCPIIPPGSKWTLTCDDNDIFPGPDGACFKDVPMGPGSPAIAGCHFTGATRGRDPRNLTLAITWCDGGKKIPPPRVIFKIATTEPVMLNPINYMAGDQPAGSNSWPFYVGSKYPYIGNEPNPSPLPSFLHTGRNDWPYQGAPQFVVGHVAMSAKLE